MVTPIEDDEAASKKVSNAEVAVQSRKRFSAWIVERLRAGDWHDYIHAGKLNRTEVAKECGFGRSAWTQNELLGKKLHRLEKRLKAAGLVRQQHLPAEGDSDGDARIEAIADLSVRRAVVAKAKAEHRVKFLEEQNATLRAEVRDLNEQLRKVRMREDHLSKTGRLLYT